MREEKAKEEEEIRRRVTLRQEVCWKSSPLSASNPWKFKGFGEYQTETRENNS